MQIQTEMGFIYNEWDEPDVVETLSRLDETEPFPAHDPATYAVEEHANIIDRNHFIAQYLSLRVFNHAL